MNLTMNELTENIISWAMEHLGDRSYAGVEQLTALTGDHPKYIGWVPLERVLAEKDPEQKGETV